MKIRVARHFGLGITTSLAVLSLGVMSLGTGGCGGKKPPKPMEPAMTDTHVDTASVDAGAEDVPAPAAKTLYDRLGGKEGVDKVIASFLSNATADADLKKSFAKVTGPKLENFKKQLADFVCEAAQGGCKYGGKDMKVAHKGMGITEPQWDAFVKDFTLALDENKVGEKEKSEVFAAIAPLRDDVVEKKTAPKKSAP
jgi:hemoglobin